MQMKENPQNIDFFLLFLEKLQNENITHNTNQCGYITHVLHVFKPYRQASFLIGKNIHTHKRTQRMNR